MFKIRIQFVSGENVYFSCSFELKQKILYDYQNGSICELPTFLYHTDGNYKFNFVNMKYVVNVSIEEVSCNG